jgi:hypothetical protein
MTTFVRRLAVACAAATLIASYATESRAQVARNVAEFCGIWVGVCNRTCPAGAGNCTQSCNQRAADCRASGCFFFNIPRPRCFNNPADLQLTNAALAPNPAAERARRGIK